jgi:hypothetical protein
MTDRRKFLRTSGLMAAAAAFTVNPAKEAAINDETRTDDFNERVRVNQQKLTAKLKPHYDFIVCGSGSSGSVVARRLAETRRSACSCLDAGAQLRLRG